MNEWMDGSPLVVLSPELALSKNSPAMYVPKRATPIPNPGTYARQKPKRENNNENAITTISF